MFLLWQPQVLFEAGKDTNQWCLEHWDPCLNVTNSLLRCYSCDGFHIHYSTLYPALYVTYTPYCPIKYVYIDTYIYSKMSYSTYSTWLSSSSSTYYCHRYCHWYWYPFLIPVFWELLWNSPAEAARFLGPRFVSWRHCWLSPWWWSSLRLVGSGVSNAF